MCVNNLPKVVTRQCPGAESNLRLWVTSGLQVRHVAVRLPSHIYRVKKLNNSVALHLQKPIAHAVNEKFAKQENALFPAISTVRPIGCHFQRRVQQKDGDGNWALSDRLYPVYTIKQSSSKHRANVEQTWGKYEACIKHSLHEANIKQTSSQLVEPASSCKRDITDRGLSFW